MLRDHETQQHPIEVEFYILFCFLVFGLFSSFIGDLIILIGTKTYGAFNLNKLLIAVIQHIAVTDVATCFLWILPVTVNMISIISRNEWVFKDEVIAFARYRIAFYIQVTNAYLVVVLTATKLLILKFPLKVSSWSKNRAHCVCTAVWLLNLWVPAALSVIYGNHPKLEKDWNIVDLKLKYFIDQTRVMVVLIILFPLCVVIFTTIPTLFFLLKARKVSKQSGGKVRWHGLLTVVLTASVFCVSYTPYLLIPLSVNIATKSRLTWYGPLLNIMSNFYIYIFTVPSFRHFLQSKLRCFRGRVSECTVVMGKKSSSNKNPLSSHLSQL